MNEFTPTYLYIKQHYITGKLYFGKTIKDVIIYKGSGKRWKNHIDYHGRQYVTTLWYELFFDKEEMMRFAIEFSRVMNIVESEQWLNLIPENGVDGCPIGIRLPQSEEHKTKIGAANKGKKHSQEQIEQHREFMTGRQLTEEHKKKISDAGIGRIVTQETRDRIAAKQIGISKPITEETKKKIGDGNRGKVLTEDTKQKMRDHAAIHGRNMPDNKGRIHETLECPHCKFVGRGGAMKRYHFDNCKS